MNTIKTNSPLNLLILTLFLFLALTQFSKAQINFAQSNLNFNGNGNVSAVTGMTFGPDSRLYVVEYTGAVKILTIERNGPTDYVVTNNEVLDGILTIKDHDDDGVTRSDPAARETIGIAVGGTATNPVFYVSSSDIRIGAGSGGGSQDVGLDTNSGIITRFSWNGASWDVVDIVRGLPRSEENHATNGLELATINGTNYLIAASGGHTNGGAPSVNFVFTCEYALSGAVLAINLDMLEAMPILNDDGRDYIYDLPTLDDPTRPNVNGITDPDDPGYDGIDIGDPFGGNDGLNMAIIDPDGPVQILSPGYRNAYDLVVTESGALYVTDNGANQGWGGLPENQGTANATNNYIPGEPGSTASNPAASGEFVDNVDHLQLVTTNLNTYTFNSLYGGHPNPVRANPQGAGLYTDNTSALGTFGSPIWRTQIYDPDGSRPNSTTNPNQGLPANWPPVQIANPVEGDWRGPTIFNPDGPQDNPVVTWGTNTNSIAEYTASNFNGALKGNLLAGHSGGNIRRVILSQDGTTGTLDENFFSGLGGNVLGLTSNGDNDIFPGTVWGGTFNGNIVVLEPQDAINCIAPDDPEFEPLADYDGDGYTNQDEIDNGTDYCNGGSQPSDFDKILGPPFISDLNDPDDDGDGIPDAEDPFQLGNPLKPANEQAFTIPIANDLFNDQQGLGGIFGLGMTGLMNNGDTGPNWLNWIDRRDDPNDPNPNDVLGGAPGIMTSHMTSGTANGSINNQEKGYQYGVKVDANTSPFSVIGGMNGFDGSNLRLYGNTAAIGGELGFFIGDGTQSNFIKFVVTVDGFTVQQEIDDIPQTPTNVVIPVEDRTTDKIRFYFVVNPANGEVSFSYRIDSNPKVDITTLTAQGKILEVLQDIDKDLAVGFIGTSGAAGVELEGSWDFLNVLDSQPFVNLPIPNIDRLVGSPTEEINLNNYFTDDGDIEELTFTVTANTDSSIGAIIVDNTLSLTFPALPALSNITIRATDADENFVEQSFTVIVTEEPTVLYRVNAGGPEITAIDDAGVNWSADTVANNNEYLQEPGSNTTFSTTINSTTNVNTDKVPVAIFTTERFDSNPGPPNLTYAFPVAENGNYEVRLYLMNGFDGTSQPGQRIFNVTIEGNPYPQLSGVDLSDRFGHKVGSVISTVVPVNDGEINISFLHDTENPLINGIEILEATSLDTPIYVGVIPDQISFPGEALDGSLGVVAIGGDGNLQFSAAGLPPGVVIEPTNGQIGGTLGPDSADNSPYLVTITIDDSDAISTDAVTIQFLWTVEIIPLEIVAIEDFISEVEDNINIPIITFGGFPLETITYSIEGQPNGITIDSETGIITGIITEGAEIGGPNNDGIYNVTITATGTESGPIISNFIWTVKQKSLVVFRLNAGGAAFTATDGELDWVANNTIGAVNGAGYNVNTGNIAVGNLIYANRDSSIPAYIDEATYTAIFAQERWDPPALPEMQFDFPLPNGDYIVNLYLGNSFSGTSTIGSRVFNISVEGILAADNLDLVERFGNQVGGMISVPVTLNDEVLNILFEHVVENPLINAIEILNVAAPNAPILVNNINDQTNFVGDEINPGFGVEAFGGTGDLQYTAVGLPPGISLNPNTGEFSGTIELNAEQNSPYNVIVTVDDSDAITTDAISVEFTWTIKEAPLVVFRVNAGGAAFTATDGELDWVANNTIGAVNGQGYSVNTGNITTGNLIYANRDSSIPSYIDEATFNTIFAQERWDSPALPEMQFDIPLPNGDYIVNLYLGNSFSGTSTIGSRVFNISVEGILAADNLDLVERFGNQVGGMISVPVSLTDEVLNVLFERVVENPLINAIEIVSRDGLVYYNNAWIPSVPDDTTSGVNATILNGTYTIQDNSNVQINKLDVRSGASVIVEAGSSITTQSNVKVSGTMELLSTSTSYASLIPNGTVEGNILYKRHVNRTANPGASDANDLISAPLTGQSFVEFLSNNDNIVSNSTNTLYLFGPFNKETGAYVVYSDAETATLDPAIGYRAASTNTSTFTFTGTVNIGPISVPISNSGPAFQIWNLIGNPYPSYIKVGDFLNENNSEFANNSAAIYGYDGNASDGWTVWNLAYAAQNPDALITPGQGFFVSSKPEGGTVNFLPSMREKGTSDDFILGRSTSTTSSYLRLNLSQSDKSYHTDFYFNANSSRGLDKGYDAQIWGGTAPNFSIFSYLAEGNTGLPLAIQSVDETDYSDLTIPLGVKASIGQQLKISMAENTLPSNIGVYLEDALTQTSVLINNNDYVLTPSSTLNAFGRFYLAFRDNALSLNNSEFNKLKVFSNFESQSIIIYGLITEPTVAKLYDAQGRLVISRPLSLDIMQQSFYTNQLEKGVYIISLESNSAKMTQKVIIK